MLVVESSILGDASGTSCIGEGVGMDGRGFRKSGGPETGVADVWFGRL